ncbi:hypothetical protein ASJ33_05515 [Dehalococcoides mccartyi]|uniref:hypothetical protein n=1 Tax=Dehalococcoides mccartyi TaxID=61435 RepID=UPI0009098DFA|nr:hypothetical protein [Dehalococcoides mccartyi]APH12647.1 hypothetical protein ASJ33_05515 [Dehalococcoides mccartyi]
MAYRYYNIKQVDLKELTEKELAKIITKIQAVKESGFGEVKVCIRNGSIYRIIKTEEEMMETSKN